MSLSTIDQSTGNATVISGNVNDKVGNLAALTTTDKSSCVGAINEVKSDLTNLGTYANCTDAMQVESGVSIYGKTLYTNGKEMYGSVILDISQATSGVIANILTGYRPISRWAVSAMSYDDALDSGITSIVIIQTNGDISIEHIGNKPYLLFSFAYPIGN